MTNYQKVSLFAAIIILVIFVVLSLVKQSISYLWPGLLPVLILLATALNNKVGRKD